MQVFVDEIDLFVDVLDEPDSVVQALGGSEYGACVELVDVVSRGEEGVCFHPDDEQCFISVVLKCVALVLQLGELATAFEADF